MSGTSSFPGSSAQKSSSASFSGVLQNRYFLRLWIAQLFSQTNMNAANYGLITLVAAESGSLLATGGAIVAFSLPALLIGAPAGAIVDRFDRRTVLWVSNVLRGVATLLFVLSLWVDRRALIPVYALAFFISMVGQFFGPAEGAAIPKLVRKHELLNALALFNITFTISQALGLIFLGPLILLLVPEFRVGGAHLGVTVHSVDSLMILIALIYFLCAGLILMIPGWRLAAEKAPGAARKDRGQLRGIGGSILESATFIVKRPLLSVVVWQLSLAGVITAVVAMIAPAFVKTFFDKPPQSAALVFLPAGVGLVLGAAFTPNIARRVPYGRMVSLGVGLVAGCLLIIPLVAYLAQMAQPHGWQSNWLYTGVMLVLMFVIGVALDFINVPAQTQMQERSPDYIKGRVLAVQIMLMNTIAIPFIFIIGGVADYTHNLSLALIVLALLVGAIGAITMFIWSRAHRQPASVQGADAATPDAIGMR